MRLWQKLTDLFEGNDVTQEMSKRYKDTLMCITVGSNNYYAYYRGLSDDGFHTFRDQHDQRIMLSETTDYEVSVPRLESGAYNTKHGTVYVTSIPARQWKRGLSQANTHVRSLQQVLQNMEGQNGFKDYIFDVVDNQLQRVCSLKDARILAEETGSHSCDRNFSVMLDPMTDTDTSYLFYNRYVIGRVDGLVITVLNPVFIQEILDKQRNLFSEFEVI